ncbi:hypothetical protein WG219_10880 [Ectopseudomonas mendocina]|jgi:hypothetical protein|uniref:Uncharacterized protein n=1 Tax=Ectopseudomonas mendocina TaxID=300 RepID=A0ABZ2RLJ0_ECTME|nr:hypothetical protein [Pseudomonas sp. UBA6718]
MLIQLLDYSIENEGSTNAWANISIKIDNIGPIRWHITPSEWNQQDFDIGIGAPSDEIDISGLSAAEKTQLFGAVIEDEDIYDLESKVSQALKSEFKEIMRKIKS